MLFKKFVSLIAMLSLAGCSFFPNVGVPNVGIPNVGSSYCERQPFICALAGVIIVGGAIALIRHNGGNDDNGISSSSSSSSTSSDSRLKVDVKLVDKLDNGIKLYAFKYLGDNRTFVGVMAQEIAKMPKFSAAVSRDADGYYRVDYASLGFEVVEMDQMQAASKKAKMFVQ